MVTHSNLSFGSAMHLFGGRLFALPQFPQHLVGRYEKRILFEGTADNHHRVCPQDIHDHVGTKLVQIVSSANGVVVFRQEVV